MPGLYNVKVRTAGETITAQKYMEDHEQHRDNHIPTKIDDFSADANQMNTQEPPYPGGSLSRPTSLAEELTRIRYQIAQILGKPYWYMDTATDLASLSTRNDDQDHLAGRAYL